MLYHCHDQQGKHVLDHKLQCQDDRDQLGNLYANGVWLSFAHTVLSSPPKQSASMKISTLSPFIYKCFTKYHIKNPKMYLYCRHLWVSLVYYPFSQQYLYFTPQWSICSAKYSSVLVSQHSRGVRVGDNDQDIDPALHWCCICSGQCYLNPLMKPRQKSDAPVWTPKLQ